MTVKVLIRDFDTARLPDHAAVIRQAADAAVAHWPGSSVDINICTQFRNMADGLADEPRAVPLAEEAMRRAKNHISTSTVQNALKAIVLSLGWEAKGGRRPITPHTLRHLSPR